MVVWSRPAYPGGTVLPFGGRSAPQRSRVAQLAEHPPVKWVVDGVATIPRGEAVDVIDCHGAWCEIDWRGYGGFASRSYLAYGYRGPRVNTPPVPVVVVPPPAPPPPPGPVVYSVPYYDPPIVYRGGGVGVFFGF